MSALLSLFVRASTLCLVCVLATALVIVEAQRSTPGFRSGIDLVHLEVSVLDRERHPVSGLTAKDFTVRDEGRRQEIQACVEVSAAARSAEAGGRPDLGSDIETNATPGEPGRLLVIILDDALIPTDPAAISAAKVIARGVVQRLGPNDLVSWTRPVSGSQ